MNTCIRGINVAFIVMAFKCPTEMNLEDNMNTRKCIKINRSCYFILFYFKKIPLSKSSLLTGARTSILTESITIPFVIVISVFSNQIIMILCLRLLFRCPGIFVRRLSSFFFFFFIHDTNFLFVSGRKHLSSSLNGNIHVVAIL